MVRPQPFIWVYDGISEIQIRKECVASVQRTTRYPPRCEPIDHTVIILSGGQSIKIDENYQVIADAVADTHKVYDWKQEERYQFHVKEWFKKQRGV